MPASMLRQWIRCSSPIKQIRDATATRKFSHMAAGRLLGLLAPYLTMAFPFDGTMAITPNHP